MAGKCVMHKGRASKKTLFKQAYCEDCVKQIENARIDKQVRPKECFVWHVNNKKGFQAIPGTGCAHWVAHQKNWKGSKPACLEGYPLRVSQILKKVKKLNDGDEVKKGDVWATKTHCGIVSAVQKGKGDAQLITIEHCSSAQGGVKKNDWQTYFKGGGAFYR